MAVVGVLTTLFKGDTKHLSKSTKNAGGIVSRFGRTMGSAARAVVGLGVVAATVAAAKLTLMTKASFAAMDATGKMADRVGTTTEELTGLQYAASQTGISSMEKNLGLLSRTLGEAKQGVGEGKDALLRLGLSVDALLAMSPAEQIGVIGDAMMSLGSAEERAATAADLFGRGGLEMVNLLATGTAGVQRFIKANEILGASFSRIDAGKIEEANDAIDRAKVAARGMANTIATQLAPTVANLGNLASYVFANWTDVSGLALAQMKLKFVSAFNVVTHFFTSTVPAALEWFGRNWREAFITAGRLVETVFMNLGDNLFALATNILDILRGKIEIADIWKPLTEGFESAITESLVLPDRVMGALERQLTTERDALAAKVGAGWVAFEEGVIKVPKVEVEPQAEDAMTRLADALKGPAALERGSSEAFTASLQPRYDALAKHQQENVKATRDVAKGITETNRILTEQLPTLIPAAI
ncbi:MAG TPA: hypothetical protein VM487_18630 [Phycisphaerae bacterium]|nr:hypothetical protein [Phycisphaerae bacterium]